jgi:TolB-like protein
MSDQNGNGGMVESTLVQNELNRVLSSQTFRRANRMRELLGYVVKETLDGAALTEAKAAHEVFGKDENFDASIDPEVRIQYGRLRRKLAEYYATEGKQAALMIDLPPRKYGPVFLPHKGEETAVPLSPSSGPSAAQAEPELGSIAVLPFANLTNDAANDVFCYGLTEEIISRLASESSVDVVASSSAFLFKDKSVDVREVGAELGVQMILEGSVRMEDTHTRVMVRLARVNDGIAVWSDSFDAEVEGALNTQQSVADKVMASLPADLGRKQA